LNPLLKVQESHKKGLLPDKIYHIITERFPVLLAGIDGIEKASEIIFQGFTNKVGPKLSHDGGIFPLDPPTIMILK